MINLQICTSLVLVICSLMMVLVQAKPQYEPYDKILKQNLDIRPDGTHEYSYETSNGIYEDQQGFPKGPETQAVQGQFQYQSPEGQTIHLTYTADENGFQPQGDHLPTPPPIPPAIQRALEYLAKYAPRSDQQQF